VTIELRILAHSAVLGIAQVIAALYAASLQRGYRWSASLKDEETPPPRGVAGRPDRALRNFVETFRRLPPSSSQRTFQRRTMRSPSGMRLYFWARIAYVPL
jgi:uncharacterized MAPEG superfamily protein